MTHKEKLSPYGFVRVTHICKDKDGNEVDLKDAIADKSMVDKVVERHNLVVNAGRAIAVRAIGGYYENASMDTPFIDRITLGDGQKTNNLPNLSDTGLVSEIQKLDGTIAGTFLLNAYNDVSPEITFPAAITRISTQGPGTVAIDGNGVTTLTDGLADFVTDGVRLTDQVTLNNSAVNPLVLGIKNVQSATVLELHNPTGYTGSVTYSVGTAGNQMLVSKLVSGNSFVKADYGVAVLVTEAGLLFNNGTMFNRVVFAPQDEDSGILLQSDETNGTEISARFEWLVTI